MNSKTNVLDTLYGNEEIQIPDIILENDQELIDESFVKQSPEIPELDQDVVPSTVAPE